MSLITEDNALGTGSASTFSFSFKYVKESDVYVSVDDVVKTKDTHYTFAPNTSSITFLPAHIPALNAKVRIYRETSLTDPAAEFFPGSAIRAQDLNANNDQVLFSAQERKERSLDTTGGTITGSVTVNGDIIFEGLTEDANETTLTVVDPTQDNTITLPNASGHVPLLAVTSTTQITATPAEINTLDGITASTAELNHTVGVTSAIQTQLDNKQPLDAELTELATMDATTASSLADLTSTEVQILDNLTTPTADLNLIQGLTATAAELNKLDACTTSTAELNKLTGVTTTSAEFNKLSGLSASTANLDITNNMTKSTTLVSSSDTEFPTSKAVADWVNTQLDAIDGFVAIADENSFPNTQPPDQVTVSIADAGGIAVNGSGVGTGQTAGGATVTINNFASNFHNTTIVAGVRLLVESTGAGQIYNYHKATLKESDLVNLSDDIQDFNERYRVGATNPTTNNDGGDLFFNTGSNKMLVYNATNTAWEEVQSIGQFFEIPASELADFAAGTSATEVITNAPATAQQIILSINGVIQKPSSGTGTPTEGFTLSGATITLAATPPAGSTVFGVIIGSSVNVGTPSANTVDTLQLVADSVDNTILDSTVGVEAVNTNVIRDDAVTSDKLADSLSTDADRAVTTNHIRDNAVTFAKMQNTTTNNRLLGAVTAGTVGEVQVQTAMIAPNAITSNEILDGEVTEPKLGTANAGSTGQFLQKTGATTMDWATVSTQAFPSGTKMLFNQTAAPTGWTKDTTNNDNSAIRVVTGSVGTGGSDGFTTTFGTGKATAGHQLTVAEMPSHNHPIATAGGNNYPYIKAAGQSFYTNTTDSTAIKNTGGDQPHSHNLSGFDLKYVDVIVATHN